MHVPNLKLYISNHRRGQSLIEILVGVAIGALLIISAASIIAPVLKTNTQTYRAQTGTALAKQLLDSVNVWAEQDWHNLYNLATSSATLYYLTTSTSPFTVVTGTESVSVSTTTYKRYFYVDIANRDSAGNLVATSTGSLDPSTRKVTVGYSWPNATTNTISTYVTRNANKVYVQTDWSSGPNLNGPVTSSVNGFATSTSIDYTSSSGSIYIKFN